MMAEMQARAQAAEAAQARREVVPLSAAAPREPALAGAGAAAAAPALAPGVDPSDPGTWGQSGRNDPCPCGSGLKWKKCTCKEYHPDQQ